MEENKKGKQQKVVHLKAYKFDERSKDISLLPGMPIIARMNNKSLNIMNNEMFRITKADANFITFTSSENTSIACMSIPTKDFVKLFKIAFAITIHCAMGLHLIIPLPSMSGRSLTRELNTFQSVEVEKNTLI